MLIDMLVLKALCWRPDRSASMLEGVLGDDLLSILKVSWSFPNSVLWHLWSPLDTDLLPVPETLQSSSYSESLPVISSTVTCSFHPNTSSDTSSEGSSETYTSSEGNSQTSSNSVPSDQTSASISSEHSQSWSGDGVAAASNIKGHVIGVIQWATKPLQCFVHCY